MSSVMMLNWLTSEKTQKYGPRSKPRENKKDQQRLSGETFADGPTQETEKWERETQGLTVLSRENRL